MSCFKNLSKQEGHGVDEKYWEFREMRTNVERSMTTDEFQWLTILFSKMEENVLWAIHNRQKYVADKNKIDGQEWQQTSKQKVWIIELKFEYL